MDFWTLLGQSLINGLLLGGVYALIGVGLTLIFGVMGIVNFAHGDLLMLSMYITYWLGTLFGIDPYVSIPFVACLMIVVGFAIYRFLINPVLDSSHINQAFTTIGLSIVLQNLALAIWGADFRTINLPYSNVVFSVGGIKIVFLRLCAFIISLAATFILYAFLKKTYVGKAIRATSQNRIATELMGINTNRIYLLTFGIGASLLAIAGAILIPLLYVYPMVGATFTLTTFVIVIIGGLGSFFGALIGGLIIGLTESINATFFSTSYSVIMVFLVFLIILMFRPRGLFGLRHGWD